eukprot:COSAG03_NODE_1243_length_4488_cov_2.936660_3_plen_44_part_00
MILLGGLGTLSDEVLVHPSTVRIAAAPRKHTNNQFVVTHANGH